MTKNNDMYTRDKTFNKKPLPKKNSSETEITNDDYDKLMEQVAVLNTQYTKLLVETNTLRKRMTIYDYHHKQQKNALKEMDGQIRRLARLIELMLREDEDR